MTHYNRDYLMPSLNPRVSNAQVAHAGRLNEYGAGPFDLNGDVFSIRKRGIKNEDDVIIGSTFFMVKAGGKLQKV